MEALLCKVRLVGGGSRDQRGLKYGEALQGNGSGYRRGDPLNEADVEVELSGEGLVVSTH